METKDLILAGLGLLLSVGFKLIPPLANWYYGKLNKDLRGIVMVGFCLGVSLIIFGLSCAGIFDWVSCNINGVKELIRGFLVVVAGNLVTFLVTPETKLVREAKLLNG